MIKKIISCLCAVVLIVNIFIVNISANSESEFEELFDTAFRRYTTFYSSYLSASYYDNENINRFFEYVIKYRFDGDSVVVSRPFVSDEGIVDGTIEFNYVEFYVENFSNNPNKPIVKLDTIEDVTSYMSECMTAELTKKFMILNIANGQYILNLFELSENNKLLINDTQLVWHINYFYDNFRDLEISGNTAVAKITLWYWTASAPVAGKDLFGSYLDGEPCHLPMTATVEFTKTADGWRVSGGTAFEVMLGDREPNSNPNTGDTSSVIVPALTVTALISVALPVGIMRKRRRFA